MIPYLATIGATVGAFYVFHVVNVVAESFSRARRVIQETEREYDKCG